MFSGPDGEHRKCQAIPHLERSQVQRPYASLMLALRIQMRLTALPDDATSPN